MAADDDERGPEPDAWDEIVAGDLGGEAEEVSFRFEETADARGNDPEAVFSEDGGPAENAGDESTSVSAAEDALVEDWLSGGDGELSSSAVDIGTGASGIALHGEPDQEEIGTAEVTGGAATGDGEGPDWSAFDTSGGAAGEDANAAGGFPDIAATGAAAVGAARKTVRRPSQPAKKAGGIGQMVGVVLGGVMAIPITLAILIYGLGKDPFGFTKKVPAEVAFLLPGKFRPGYKKPSASAADTGSALDDLPAVAVPEDPVPETDEPAEPAPGEPTDVAGPDMPPEIEPEPAPEPAVPEPGLDDLAATPVPPAPVEPPPLDTLALDEAVGEAEALGNALRIVEDRGSPAYKKLRTRWYRALARVAEELVAVENAAATSSRPLAAAPDNVTALHGGIGGQESLMTELAALAPDWLAYEKRGSDGVVLPVTFASARRVGPYWTARMTLAASDGKVRDLTVVSRSEPAAIAGDRLVVTGVALDGGVIWAADVRPATAGGDLSAGF